jgi:hypothetical protein
MLDMSFNFRLKGYIQYKKKKYYIDAMKTHDGPVFHLEYFEKRNKKIEDIVKLISPKLISIIDKDFNNNGPMQNKEYIGEIEIPKKE